MATIIAFLILNEFGCLAHQLKLYSVYETYNNPIGLLERKFERFIVTQCQTRMSQFSITIGVYSNKMSHNWF